MNFLPGVISLQAAQPEPSPFSMFVPMILIFFIFYFLLIRPQNKQRQEREDMIKKIEKGDTVVTSGGLHGKVVGVTDDVLTLEIAVLKSDRVRVKVDRPQVDRVQEQGKKGDDS